MDLLSSSFLISMVSRLYCCFNNCCFLRFSHLLRFIFLDFSFAAIYFLVSGPSLTPCSAFFFSTCYIRANIHVWFCHTFFGSRPFFLHSDHITQITAMTILLPHSHFATTYISPISSNFTLAARVPVIHHVLITFFGPFLNSFIPLSCLLLHPSTRSRWNYR